MKRFSFRGLCPLLCFLWSIESASGVLIGVDFGDPNPINWNSGPAGDNPQGLTNLIDEAGNITAVDITYNGAASSDTVIVGYSPNPAQIPSHTNSLANIDGVIGDGSAMMFTFSDLAPSSLYNIYVFGGNGSLNEIHNITISGSGAPLVFTQTLGSDPGELWVNAQQGSNAPLSTFALSILSSATGTITVDAVAGNSSGVGIAALAIEAVVPNGSAVPEGGSSAFLFGLVMAMFVGWNRLRLTAGGSRPA